MATDINMLHRAIRLAAQAAGLVDYPGFPVMHGLPGDDIRVEAAGISGYEGMPIPEPSDLKFLGNVSALPSNASGVGQNGTEVKFNVDGIIIPMPGAVGAFWSRSLKDRWAGIQPGRPIIYTQSGGFIVAQDSAVTAAGQLAFEFYAKPPNESMRSFYNRVRNWTAQSSEGGAGSIVAALGGSGAGSGTDVTLGTFTQNGASPTQIFLVGTNMPVGGATKPGQLIISTPNNTDLIFVGETSALAAASNNPIGQLGEDVWNIPKGGKAFFLSNSGTQTASARFRS